MIVIEDHAPAGQHRGTLPVIAAGRAASMVDHEQLVQMEITVKKSNARQKHEMEKRRGSLG
jgi:hypothetical protein